MSTLLRVGWSAGPFHPRAGEPARHHVVRVGWDTPKLTGDDELDVWSRAPAVAEAELDPGVVGRLVDRGLLVRVGPDPADRASFAARYRVQPLLLGAADVDGRHPVGPAGGPPVALLDDADFELWAFANLFPDLASAAAALTAADSGDGDVDAVLARLVDALPRLLADDLVYLDVVRDRT